MRSIPKAAAVVLTIIAAACSNTASTTQMADQNAALARRAIDEIWGQKNFASIAQIYAANYTSYTHGKRDTTTLEQRVKGLQQQYPDFKVTVDDIFATADHVAMRWTFTGTDKTAGKPVTVPGISFMKVVDGKIVEGYGDWDDLGPTLAAGYTLTPPAGAPKPN